MKKGSTALLLWFSLLGQRVVPTHAQPVYMDPSQNKDPAYAQLDLANRMNQWNIRQLGFQIVARGTSMPRGKPMSQAELDRVIQKAKKLNRYNSAVTMTHYKHSGSSMIPTRLLQGVALDDVSKRLAIGLMEKSLSMFSIASMHDGFEAHDLAWATVYFLNLSYLVARDSSRTGKSSTQYTSIAPDLSFKIYRQIHTSLSQNPAIRKMTNAQKQMASENLAIMAGTSALLYDEMVDPNSLANLSDGLYGPKTSPEEKEKKIAAIKQQAQRNLEKVFGVPSSKIKITQSGVVLK